MTLHPLEQKLAAALRRQRLWQFVRGLGLFVTLIITVVLVAAVFDYTFRLQEVGARILLTSVVLVLISLGFRRLGRYMRRWKTGLLPLAHKLEQHYPVLSQQLASAVEFLRVREKDEFAGSVQLRHRMIDRTAALAMPLDFTSIIDVWPAVQAATTASLCLLLTLWVGWSNPSLTGLSVSRLAMPWSDLPWPRRHELEIETAKTRVPRGASYEIVARDRSRFPLEVVQVQIREDATVERRVETAEMTARDDRWIYRRERVLGDFSYRVTGGDDTHDSWHAVEVVDPPRIERLELRTAPPPYTQWPSTIATPPLRVLQGTVLELKAWLSSPVQAAWIRALNVSGSEGNGVAVLPWEVNVLDAGQELALTTSSARPWKPEVSGIYVLEVRDAWGLEAELSRWSLQVVPDAPPVITWTEPRAESRLRLSGAVTTKGVIQDDVRVARAEFQMRELGEESGSWISIPLRLSGAEASKTASSTAIPLNAEVVEWQESWKPTMMPQLTSGMKVEIRVAAMDDAGLTGYSEARTVVIVTDEELREHWQHQVEAILELLREALQVQQLAHQQTLDQISVRRLADKPANVEALKLVLLQQQRVVQVLSEEAGGVPLLIRAIRHEMNSNLWQDNRQIESLDAILAICQQLNAGPVMALSSLLPRAVKESPADSVMTLMEASVCQQEIVTALEQLLDQQASSGDVQRWQSEVTQLRAQQSELLDRTTTQLVELESMANTMTAEQRAAVRRLGEEQAELARRFQRLQQQAAKLVEPANEEPDDGAQRPGQRRGDQASDIERLTEKLQESTAGGLIADASRSLQRNRLGEATEQQQQAVHSLDELIDQLARRPASDRQITSPEEAAARVAHEAWLLAVDRLLERQTPVLERLRSRVADQSVTEGNAGEAAHELASDEQELPKLERDIANLAQQYLVELPPLRTFQFVLRLAVSDLRAASKLLSQKNWPQALGAADLATQRLQQLRAALAKPAAAEQTAGKDESQAPAAQPKKNLSKATLKQSRAELVLVRDFQTDLRERTAVAEESRSADGQLSPEQRRDLERVAREQSQLAELLWEFVEQEAATLKADEADQSDKPNSSRMDEEGEDIGEESPQTRLMRLGRQMTQVSERLSQEDSSAATQALQDRILGELENLIDSAGNSAGQASAQAAAEPTEDKSSTKSSTGNLRPTDKPSSGDKDPDSSSGADQSGPAAAQRFTKEIWGELPAQQREELINALPDKFLPLYESMLEQYYRRLSTQKMK
ncbi:MAG: hypothetical protein ACKOU6_18410 [Planctomycetota bacterium]